MSRATLGDLVEDYLRLQLGYGEEIVVNHGDNLLYDVDETENLEKKLSELGIKDDSFLTVIDDDEENPRVNLVLNVQESTAVEDMPIRSLDINPVSNGNAPSSPIPRRKKSAVPQSNGFNGHDASKPATSNGNGNISAPSSGKRTVSQAFDGDDAPASKKTKVQSNGQDDGPIELDGTDDGAILISDD